MVRGREKFKKYKSIMNIIIKIISLFPKKFRIHYFEKIRFIPGIIGLGLRYAFISSLAKSVGENVSIHQGVYLFYLDQIEIGNNVSIHPMSYLDGFGGIKIGNDVSIAHSTTILSSNHNYSLIDIPIKDQGMEKRFTDIHDNVWIGAKTTILGGVTIKSGVIVAAGAVVTKNFDENSILLGVPAISKRR